MQMCFFSIFVDWNWQVYQHLSECHLTDSILQQSHHSGLLWLHPNVFAIWYLQSYVIKSAPWTILWFRILGIFSVENIKRLCVFMFQTWDNSQLLRRVLWISAELTIVSSLKHKNTQPLYIFNRVRVLHLDRLKEGTWLHSFADNKR